MEKEKRMSPVGQRLIRHAVLLLFTAGIGAALIAGVFIRKAGKGQERAAGAETQYKYHYMLISESQEEELKESLYEGARKAGEEQGILVEDLTTEEKKTTEELLKTAIAARADGIIVEGNGTKEVKELIDRASEENIPVATILCDAEESKRKCFVGIDTRQMGEIYGNRLQNLYEGEKLEVAVLVDSEEGSLEHKIYQIIETSVPKDKFAVYPVEMERENTFSSDEKIRSLFLTKKKTPDILVCLSALDSVCAYQVAVDLNLVGKVQILGYSSLQEVVSAVSKEVIHASVLVDMNEVGRKAVETLFCHRNTRNADEFVQVDIQVIEKENTANYWKGENR